MNDWQEVVIEELKSLNRKLERLDSKMDKEIDPIKAHVAQVRLVGILVSISAPLLISALALFL
jgi:hypothetical protein